MKLWREDDVRSVMETQEFHAMAAKAAARKAASAKAVETKRKNGFSNTAMWIWRPQTPRRWNAGWLISSVITFASMTTN